MAETQEVVVYRLVPEKIQVTPETLEKISKSTPYTNTIGDACYILRATQLGLAPGHCFLMWGV